MKSLETIDVGVNGSDWRDVIIAVSTAVDDAAYGKENRALNGSVTANDTPGALVFKVNGDATNVGSRITLASGALLTVNRDGSYSYDPNHKFDYLVSAATAAATGAVDATAADSFTYTLDSGSTATVTVTVRGVDGAGDQLRGNAGDNTIYGTEGNNLFNLSQGGNDTVFGGGGDDTFYFGATYDNRQDRVDGGAGADTLVLQGNYSGQLFLLDALPGIERITLLSGSDTSFGDSGGHAYSYNLAAFVADSGASPTYKINASGLGVGEHLNFDGTGAGHVSFRVIGGAGSDTLLGGRANDSLVGGGGADVFKVNASGGQDTIGDFVSGTDKLDFDFYYGSYGVVMSHTHDVDGNAVIDLEAGGTMTLIGVTKAQLQPGDFMFATVGDYYADPAIDPATGGAAHAGLDGRMVANLAEAPPHDMWLL